MVASPLQESKPLIRVQEQPFDVARELEALKQEAPGAGATSIFVGTVRGTGDQGSIESMTLEHYPGMTERALADIEAEARSRWPLLGSLIVHRFGRLEPGDDIVLVVTLAEHRQAAIEASTFLIDWLKTKAPFWKLEESDGGGQWVEARHTDEDAAQRWKRG
jgi:molybdopterin synthase catalytic subunit